MSCFVALGDLLLKNVVEMLMVTAVGRICSFLKQWVLTAAEAWC